MMAGVGEAETGYGPALAGDVPAVAKTARRHTAGSATLLLMASALVSGALGLVRIKYINYLFGAGVAQDAYQAAFKLPDLISYFLVGSAASVSLITMLNRYRTAGDEEGADRALSVVLTTMLAVLASVALIAVVFAPWAVRLLYGEAFSSDARGPMCITMTRWLVPGQLFFFIGSMMSARLQVRKIFLYQAFTPVLYNGGILLGALLLHRRLGIYSLVVGALAGVVVGSAAVNSFGAFRTGLRYRPSVAFRDPAFVEWLKSALPLMLGVSLVMFDSILFNRFAAAAGQGQLTLINNAKNLFNAPFNVIGPAAGAASLPFFAALYQQRRHADFSAAVGRSVTRLMAMGIVVSAWMIVLAPWLVDLLKGGRFSALDAAEVTRLFVIFALTLGVWGIQGIYARAFYAASDTRTPAIAGTIIVLVSVPLYWAMFRWLGMTGLAVASDVGIVVQTATLAALLHRRRLVSLRALEAVELIKALGAAAIGYGAALAIVRALPPLAGHQGDVVVVLSGSAGWALGVVVVLALTQSRLVFRHRP